MCWRLKEIKDRPFPLVVALLGVGSGACGFIAEATRPKQDDIQLQGGECVYPVSPTFVLGFVGAALVLLAVSSIAGCCKRGENVSTINYALGIVCAVMSWVAALYAALLFVLAALAYKPGRRGKAPECYTYLRVSSVFENAAVLAIFATASGLLSDRFLRARAKIPVAPVAVAVMVL